jgi:hypothetical protein
VSDQGATASVAQAALAYAGRGWPVFPCEGKRPLTAHGLLDATIARSTIERWWTRIWPDANVAIVTGRPSGLVVLDVDGEAGEDSLHALRASGSVAPTVEALTPHGRHLYFAHPGTEVRNSAGKLGPGLDVRGDGGYVIAPPSRSHEWNEGPDDLPLAELRLPAPTHNGSAPDEPIEEGARNSQLASLAGSMRRRGMDAESIAAALKVENARRCRPPLPDAEVERIAASIARYEPARLEYSAEIDSKGRLTLPEVPELGDVAGLCAWLTAALGLDREHPIVGGERMGVFGPEGLVELYRASARPVRFEPVKLIASPMRLVESLLSQRLGSDGEVPPLKADHCRHIAHAINRLCGTSQTITVEQESAGIVGTFMMAATAVEGCTTYGTSGERYEAAMALRRPLDEFSGRASGPPRFLIDSNTGELVIAVSDLQDAARRHIGSSLPRGWLDGRMDALGWQRVKLDGHALPGRDGRRGPHALVYAYRGMPASTDDDTSR